MAYKYIINIYYKYILYKYIHTSTTQRHTFCTVNVNAMQQFVCSAHIQLSLKLLSHAAVARSWYTPAQRLKDLAAQY